MPTIDPAVRLAGTHSTDDLRSFAEEDGPFATVLLPAPSDQFGSDHSLDVRWRNARRLIEDGWSEDRLVELDGLIADLDHGDAAGFVIVQRADGEVMIEPLTSELARVDAQIGEAPRLLEVLEHRQRTLPHMVVEADRTGASITMFAAGEATARDTVEGDTEHINRVKGGGWSHRRYQQRAENTWERNADDVASAMTELADEHDPVMIALAGDVRARQLIRESLHERYEDRVIDIESGDAEGITDEVVTALDDRHARFQVAVLGRLRNEQGATDPAEVREALDNGRVETLLVAGPSSRADAETAHAHHDAISGAVVRALETSAPIVVVPATAGEMTGGLAALTRW